jgi:alkylmercury lyase-like protein
MSFFRSEDHVDRWLRDTSNAKGAVVPLAQVWALAQAWYTDPRDAAWRPRARNESQAVIDSVGLIGEFWELPR